VDQPLDQGLNDLFAQRLVAGAAGGKFGEPFAELGQALLQRFGG